MKNTLAFLLAIVFCSNAYSGITESGRGMLFGEDHTFAVTAISGWVLDNQSGVNQGLHMVFYPKGATWANSPVIIYGRASSKFEIPSIKSQVDRTVSDFQKQGSPNYNAKKQSPLMLLNGKKAEIYYFSGDQWGNHEAAAYIQESDTINFLLFNSRTKESFDKHIGAFYEMVKTYENLFTSPSELSDDTLENMKKESSNILTEPGGKEYESKAVQAVGQKLADSISSCTAYFPEGELPPFSYFARINRQGEIIASYVFPTNALSACFKGLISNAHYPVHSFESFLLNLEMKIAQ